MPDMGSTNLRPMTENKIWKERTHAGVEHKELWEHCESSKRLCSKKKQYGVIVRSYPNAPCVVCPSHAGRDRWSLHLILGGIHWTLTARTQLSCWAVHSTSQDQEHEHDQGLSKSGSCVFIFSWHIIWLVVWTPLKNISQLGWLFPIYGKIKNVPNHQPVIFLMGKEVKNTLFGGIPMFRQAYLVPKKPCFVQEALPARRWHIPLASSPRVTVEKKDCVRYGGFHK